ncbi:MAG: alpha/beta hydrolase [Actinomycetota bacterium]|nr:alpha/beta hydrolase [Actinomycetota bacterium]
MTGRLEPFTIDGVALMTCTWGTPASDAPRVVMLHEGLGCITQWRDLPARVHERSGLTVVAYDRGGYGRSAPHPQAYDISFMHHEAQVVLPELLHALDIQQPILIGHSDGASIALIAACSGAVEPAGLGLVAPHIWVEPQCVAGIEAIAANRDPVVASLGRHHDHPELVFDRWRDAWLSPRFAHWNIAALLDGITCPVLAGQGDRDEYATSEMIDGIVRSVPHAEGRFLPDCGHVAHRDQPELVLQLVLDALDAATATR